MLFPLFGFGFSLTLVVVVVARVVVVIFFGTILMVGEGAGCSCGGGGWATGTCSSSCSSAPDLIGEVSTLAGRTGGGGGAWPGGGAEEALTGAPPRPIISWPRRLAAGMAMSWPSALCTRMYLPITLLPDEPSPSWNTRISKGGGSKGWVRTNYIHTICWIGG